MTVYHAPGAGVAAFLAIVCLEGLLVMLWRWIETHDAVSGVIAPPPLPEGLDRLQGRRAFMFWLGAALLMEGGHDLMRAAFYVWQLAAWPHAVSFWLTLLEAVAVLGLIRTFTREACGEWGWTVACILPLAAALGVLLG